MNYKEVALENRARMSVRKRVLVAGVSLVALGLVSGLYAYESVRGRDMNMKKGMESAAADRMTVPPPMDASRPGTIETATFALG